MIAVNTVLHYKVIKSDVTFVSGLSGFSVGLGFLNFGSATPFSYYVVFGN